MASEAGAQAKNLLGEAQTQLTDQASTQQNNLAAWLKSIVDELEGMTNGTRDPAQGGPAASLVGQVSDRAKSASTWLEEHEPADLLAATSRFARQRPGLFLALAAAGGVLAGRLTRGLTADAAPQSSTQARGVDYPSTYDTGVQSGYAPTSEAIGNSTGQAAPLTTTGSGAYVAAPETGYAGEAGHSAAPGDDLVYDDDLGPARGSEFEGGTGTDRDFR